MRIRSVFVVLVVVVSMLITVSSAMGGTDIQSLKMTLVTYIMDDYIQKCRSKCKLSDSRGQNIRKAAALAALKVEYLKANKYALISHILETEQRIKKYKVHHILNTQFFDYYASKSNLQQKVIEAKLTK